MGSKESFELAILISLRDAASAGASRVEDRLRAMGREGRQTLKTYGDLRKEVSRGFGHMGAGAAGFMLLNSGVRDAAKFETAMLDLRSAFQEVGDGGTVDLLKLQDQLNRAEHLTVNLGNRLQGSTQDYVGILAALKKAGLETEVILGGAGAAAGKLANVTGAITSGTHIEQAKELAQFGKMYKLLPQEFEASVNLFSALRDRFDIESGSLIESSKYFLGTANTLGLSGMRGASDVVKVFALLKRTGGMEGSQAGTSLASLFTMFVTHRDKIEKLSRKSGVRLNLFDSKGNFGGFEQAFREAEKLQSMSAEKRLALLNQIFGEQGGRAFNVMVEQGAAGWQRINAELAKAVPVNDKINAQMQTYEAKVEALMGSLDNLSATAFMPVMTAMKPGIDIANSLIGAVQGIAKENPQIAEFATFIIGAASAASMAKGSILMLRGSIGMLKIATAVGSGEAKFLQYLTDVDRKADRAAQSAGRAGRGWAGTMRGIGAGLGKNLLWGVGLGLPLYAIDSLLEGRMQTNSADAAALEAGQRLGELIGEGMKQAYNPKLTEDAAKELWQRRAKEEAPLRVQELGLERTASNVGMFESASEFTSILAMARGYDYFMSKGYGGPLNSAGDLMKPGRGVKETEAAARERARGVLSSKAFVRPEQLKEFLDSARDALVKGKEPLLFEDLRTAAKDVYPRLIRAVEESDGTLRDLSRSSDSAATSLFNLSRKMDGITFNAPPNFPLSSRPFFSDRSSATGGKGFEGFWSRAPIKPPHRAMGGDVRSEGLVVVHAGERIVKAADVSRGYSTRAEGRAGGTTINGGITLNINIPAGSVAANNPQAFGRAVVRHVTEAVKKQRERR